jgi:GNAT superfamily N-acetyltransferase
LRANGLRLAHQLGAIERDVEEELRAGDGGVEGAASRTFVVVDDPSLVVGYYALAAGAISHASAAGAVQRNMPDPIPVLVLGRLAVDQRARGIHLGAALLRGALVVHALNDRARDFYRHYGFLASPLHPMTMMLRLGSREP